MLDSIYKAWVTFRAMHIYLEVTLAAFAAYYWLRHIVEIDIKKVVWVPFFVAWVGQVAFVMQYCNEINELFRLDDLIMTSFMAMLQGGVASMIYTIAEKYKLIDKIGNHTSRNTIIKISGKNEIKT